VAGEITTVKESVGRKSQKSREGPSVFGCGKRKGKEALGKVKNQQEGEGKAEEGDRRQEAQGLKAGVNRHWSRVFFEGGEEGREGGKEQVPSQERKRGKKRRRLYKQGG